MATPVVLIAGDGIGPEVTTATQAVLAAAGADVAWVEATAGLTAVERFGDPLPPETLALIRRHRVALMGPVGTPIGKGFRSINVRLRKELDLFASIRPLRTLPGVRTPYSNVDIVVVRRHLEASIPARSTSSCPAWWRTNHPSPSWRPSASSATPSSWPATSAGGA